MVSAWLAASSSFSRTAFSAACCVVRLRRSWQRAELTSLGAGLSARRRYARPDGNGGHGAEETANTGT